MVQQKWLDILIAMHDIMLASCIQMIIINVMHYHDILSTFQILMNATQTEICVHKNVTTHKDHTHALVELDIDLDWIIILAKVKKLYHAVVNSQTL